MASDSVLPSAIPTSLMLAPVPTPLDLVALHGPVVPPPELPQPAVQEPPTIATSTGGMCAHGSIGPISGDVMEAIVGGQVPWESLGFRPLKSQLVVRLETQHWTKLVQVGLRDEVGCAFNGLNNWVESNG